MADVHPVRVLLDGLLKQSPGDDAEIRAVSLETLQEHLLVSLSSLSWTQLGWLWAYAASGWTWIFAAQGADLLLYGLRRRMSRQKPGRDRMTERPALAVHCLLQIQFVSLAILVLALTPGELTTIYAMLLGVGFLGYITALSVAFPVLCMVNIAALTTSCAIGLAIGPAHKLRVFLPLDAGAAVAGVLMLFQNHATLMTSLRAQQVNRMAALQDSLTKLPNRLRMYETLSSLLPVLGLPGSPRSLAVLCLDLDGFKHVNDQHGHAAGDQVLVHVGNILQKTVASGDLASRIGGDEFVILLRDADEDRVHAVAGFILREVRQAFELGRLHPSRIGVSIGAALASERGTDPEDLLKQADAALYAAKRAGKGRLMIAASRAKAKDSEPMRRQDGPAFAGMPDRWTPA